MSFLEKKNSLTDEEVDELLYYYEQGINVGKEETIVKCISNMINFNIDLDTISKITELPIKIVKQYKNLSN